MERTRWTKSEILEMGVKTHPTTKIAMEHGYFSKTILNKNKIQFNESQEDTVYAYAGSCNSYVKLYKSEEAFKLYTDKKIKF